MRRRSGRRSGCSTTLSESPICQSVGAQRPTKRARRSALPRSSWSTVLARIHRPTHRPTEPSESAWNWDPRRPLRCNVSTIMYALVPVLGVFSRALAWVLATFVSSRISLQRRLWTAALWPAGIALTSWDYMWRTTPMHRSEASGDAGDLPPRLPVAALDDDVQRIEDGAGPLFHRLYRARLRDARLSPEELISRLGADPNRATPTELARFLKVRGADGRMAVGDELVVRMPGPWDGPVRVTSVTPASFRFTTLSGHLEAGHIEFRAMQTDKMLRFEIESWARSGDALSNLLYHHLRMAKEVQLHMWTSFLEQVARLAGGRLTGGVEIVSRKVEDPLALS
jgi:hypothetical protein